MLRTQSLSALAAAAVLALVALSGCMQAGAPAEESANQAPNAELEATKNQGWTGETFHFDARGSSDRDGEIERYIFDLGDGTQIEKTNRQEATVDHVYRRGGQYVVTVTVIDDGGENAGSLSATATENVAVNERGVVAQQVLYAGPANETARLKQPVNVNQGAHRFEVDLDMVNSAPLGSSEVTLRFLGPDNSTLDEEQVTLSPQDNRTVQLRGDLDDQGRHWIEIEARSGGATIEGEFRIYYDGSDRSPAMSS
jgi:PKD repeat protein